MFLYAYQITPFLPAWETQHGKDTRQTEAKMEVCKKYEVFPSSCHEGVWRE
jgi:hypothetical protein